MSEPVCENERHCFHVYGKLKKRHGPYAPPDIIPATVFRCCNCGYFETLGGEAPTAAEVEAQEVTA